MSAKFKGMTMVVIAAVLWAVSGSMAQFLFERYHFTAGSLVTVRLIVAGIAMLTFIYFRQGKSAFKQAFATKQLWLQHALFGIFGMLGVQYTYFAAIETTDVAIATLMQYLAPGMIVLYYSLRLLKWPTWKQTIALSLAVGGTFLLLTNGDISQFHISRIGLFWGIIAAVSLAFYTLYSASLRALFGSLMTIGSGMLIGGLSLALIQRPWHHSAALYNETSISLIVLIIIFGTIIPFFLFIDSMRFITATESSLLACTEPLAATIIAALYFDIPFQFGQWLGMIAIISTVILLSLPEQTKKRVTH